MESEFPEKYNHGAYAGLTPHEKSAVMAAERHSKTNSFPLIGQSVSARKAREHFPNLHEHMCKQHLKHAGMIRFKKSVLRVLPDLDCIFLEDDR